MKSKIKVIIVDDSKLIREMVEEFLSSDPEIEVVATAVDPYDAREKIKKYNPDVITLDIEMPKMDGISFLEKIMTLRPMPVVMFSSFTQKGANATIKALEIGAIDYIGKPSKDPTKESMTHLRNEIIDKVKSASKARVRQVKKQKDVQILEKKDKFSSSLIAIGASTGGVEALKEVLEKLPRNLPPIVIVQHMPEKFTKSFANRVNNLCALEVCEAIDEQKLLPGNVYIAPGGRHMRIDKQGVSLICKIEGKEKISGHCPSVDVLFESVSDVVGKKAIGVILTGMGRDGAIGMKKMKLSGATNIGQNESSCVVYGMPCAAKQEGGVDKELSLEKIAEEIVRIC